MDWKNDVIPKVVYKLVHEYTFAPTIRGMFYNLASDGVISNTTEHYKGLDRTLVDTRNAGLIPMDAFVDNTRKIVDISNDVYWTPQSVIDYHKAKLKQLPAEYFYFREYSALAQTIPLCRSVARKRCSKRNISINIK